MITHFAAVAPPTIYVIREGRDLIEWIQVWAGLAAAVTAIIAFLYWIREQRRRPEVQFLWKLSSPGGDDWHVWEPGHVPIARPGEVLLVEASIRNVGDALGRTSITNFVVSDDVGLDRITIDNSGVLTATNDIVGVPPHNRCLFIAHERQWYPQLWWMQRFRLTIPARSPDQAMIRLLFEVEDDRLNGSGHRWLPNLIWSDPADVDLRAGAKWPPEPRGKSRPGIVRSLPKGRAACRPGQRRDIRDIEIDPN